MKVRVINKTFTFYVGDHTRPMVERLVDASGILSDEIWSIAIDASAIRDAGVRCETCKHFTAGASNNVCGDPDTPAVWASNVSPRHDFFCAHHTLLTQPSEGE